jgi:hypothetical protein
MVITLWPRFTLGAIVLIFVVLIPHCGGTISEMLDDFRVIAHVRQFPGSHFVNGGCLAFNRNFRFES